MVDSGTILLLKAYTRLIESCRCDRCRSCDLRHEIAEHLARHEAATTAKETT